MIERMFVCYVPGLDRRRVDPEHTPHVHELISTYGGPTIEPLPTTELVPSLVTGTYPHEHKVWQVQLKPDLETTPRDRVLDSVPDPIMKLWQCGRHLLNPKLDLVCLPRRRRRKLISYRFKYTRRVTQSETSLKRFNGHPSIFELLGENAHYRFNKSFSHAEARADSLVDPENRLMFYEFYGFDMFCHWQMDQPDAILKALSRVDALIARLHELCDERGIKFMLLVDHGQEAIKGQVDLPAAVRKAGIPKSEYESFSEIGVCRFWFHTDRAKEAITRELEKVEHVQLRTWRDMHQYNVCFDDNSFGDLYVYADHGYAMYPHDFAQPLGSFYRSFKTDEERGRRFNGRHRGNHGHLPDHPSEKGYVVLADEAYRARRDEVDIIDFAPSVLELMGETPLASMKGEPIFAPAAVVA